MNFYHFTSLYHLEKIKESGYIKTTASNLFPPDKETFRVIDGKAMDKNYNYRQVVWLTNQIMPTAQSIGVNGSTVNKLAVRLTISTDTVPDIKRWKYFADEEKMDATWRNLFEHGRKASSWYVVEHNIPLEDVIAIDILSNY